MTAAQRSGANIRVHEGTHDEIQGLAPSPVLESSNRPEFSRKLVVLLCATLFLSLVIRLCGFNFESGDYQNHLSRWYDFFLEHGRWNGLGKMTLEVSNYPPLYLYFLSLGTLLPLPKLYSIKLISIAFDYIAAWYVWRLSKAQSPSVWRAYGSVTALLFLPTVILNSAVWGQCDMIYTTGFLASLYYVIKRRPIAALIAFGFSLALKPQAIFWFPLLAGLFAARRLPWKWIWVPGAVYVVCGIPSILAGRPWPDVLLHWARVKNLPGLVHGAPNWYQWLGTEPDHSSLFWILGIAATVAATLLLVVLVRLGPKRGIGEPRWLLSLGLLTVLFPPFYLPGIHERYFFAADVFSVLYAFHVVRGWHSATLVQIASLFAYFRFLYSWEPIPLQVLALLPLIALGFIVKDLVAPGSGDATEPSGDRSVFQLPVASKLRWILGFQAVVFVSFLVIICGVVPEPGKWFSPDIPHRLQTDAFLRGELALSHTPAALATDLAWTRGGVHQVWGLGVPLWRLPFETFAKILGFGAFPDRLAFVVAFVVVAFCVFKMTLAPFLKLQQAGITSEPNQNRTLLAARPLVFSVISIPVLLLLFPPFVNWLRTPFTVYDEVLAYAYLYVLALIVGLIALVRSSSWPKYWFLCALSGLGGLVRPTMAFYGVATVAVAGIWMLYERSRAAKAQHHMSTVLSIVRSLKSWRWWTGVALFIAGGTFLFITNQSRFGDGMEFGHRVHVEGGSLLGAVYATRFGDPYAKEPLPSAARELFGAVFLAKQFNGFDWYREGIFPGQSKTVRWRHFYSITFDGSFAILVVLGWLASIWSMARLWRKRRTMTGQMLAQPLDAESAIIGLWSFVSAVLLAGFYLRVCCISSRYIMDFAPAFAGGILALLLKTSAIASDRHWTRSTALILLVCWTAVEIAGGKCMFGGPRSVKWNEIADQMNAPHVEVRLPKSAYTAGFDFTKTGVPLNGEGWFNDSAVAPAVILFVTDPEFIEVEISCTNNGCSDAPPLVQAKVGPELLKKEREIRTSRGWLTTFRGPLDVQNRRGIQTLFLGFGPKEELAATRTPYQLLSVSWKSPPTSATE